MKKYFIKKIICPIVLVLGVFSGCGGTYNKPEKIKVNIDDNIINDKFEVKLKDYYVSEITHSLLGDTNTKSYVFVVLEVTNLTNEIVNLNEAIYTKNSVYKKNKSFSGIWEINFVKYNLNTPNINDMNAILQPGETGIVVKTFDEISTSFTNETSIFVFDKLGDRKDYVKFRLQF